MWTPSQQVKKPIGPETYKRKNGLWFLLCLTFSFAPARMALAQDVLTWHNDSARTGQILEEHQLTPKNVNARTFGRLFAIRVDGKVDAEPLYVAHQRIYPGGLRNVLYVATEHDSLYAFDADNGQQLWHMTLLQPGETPSDNRNCGQITPEIGITATPVIDRRRGAHGAIYVVTMTKNTTGEYAQKLHALDLMDGKEQPGSPEEIHASYVNDQDAGAGRIATFDPKQYAERAALLLDHGVVYTTWTSHCDHDPYNGWILGYDASTLKQVTALDITPGGKEGAIWQSGAGPAADFAGNVYLLSANGTFDTNLNPRGFPSKGDFGNSFLKLSAHNGKLTVEDYFTPFDVEKENALDMDLGSGGALVLPGMRDAAGHIQHLVVGAAKDRNIYLLQRDAMGRFDPTGNQNAYQEIFKALKGSVYRGQPAYFDGRLYLSSADDFLYAFRFIDARLGAEPVSHTLIKFGYPGAGLSVSANGKHDAIVWAVETSKGYQQGPAVLHAYDAADLTRELYNSDQAPGSRDRFGAGNKFITPMVAHGKVYVGTTEGVGVFGLLPKSETRSRKAAAPPE
jgi:outer membrane protein assembly factor BamB